MPEATISFSWATLARKYPLSDRSIPTIDSATWCRTPVAASAARRLRPEVSKNSSTALSSNEGELARSITTCAPAMAASSPSPVMLLTPLLGEAAMTSWPAWRRIGTVFEPIRPVPPMTTIFIAKLLGVARQAMVVQPAALGECRPPRETRLYVVRRGVETPRAIADDAVDGRRLGPVGGLPPAGVSCRSGTGAPPPRGVAREQRDTPAERGLPSVETGWHRFRSGTFPRMNFNEALVRRVEPVQRQGAHGARGEEAPLRDAYCAVDPQDALGPEATGVPRHEPPRPGTRADRR